MATNFQSITESPEKLAEFLFDLDVSCNLCKAHETCESREIQGGCGSVILKWLQEEFHE